VNFSHQADTACSRHQGRRGPTKPNQRSHLRLGCAAFALLGINRADLPVGTVLRR
jgi:hypothetical protein